MEQSLNLDLAKSKKMLSEQLGSLTQDAKSYAAQSKNAYTQLQNLNTQLKSINKDTFQKAGKAVASEVKPSFLKRILKFFKR